MTFVQLPTLLDHLSMSSILVTGRIALWPFQYTQ